MINVERVNQWEYDVLIKDKLIGKFSMLEDGFFYFELVSNFDSYWSQECLNEISDKLIEINRPWQEKIEKQIGNN